MTLYRREPLTTLLTSWQKFADQSIAYNDHYCYSVNRIETR